MPQTDRTLGERAFETIVKGYRDIRGAENLPADQRVYMESVIDRRRDPLTEKSFTPAELSTMRDVVTRRYDAIKPELGENILSLRQFGLDALKNAAKEPKNRQYWLDAYRESADNIKMIKSYLATGKLSPDIVEYAKLHFGIKPNIQYEDYDNSEAINSDVGSDYRLSKEKNVPKNQTSIGQTLGRFNYTVDKEGNINITDTYDFGAGVLKNQRLGLTLKEAKKTENTPVSITDLFTPKQAAVKYARTYMPENQGRPVNIRINSAAPAAKQPTQNWFSRATNALGF